MAGSRRRPTDARARDAGERLERRIQSLAVEVGADEKIDRRVVGDLVLAADPLAMHRELGREGVRIDGVVEDRQALVGQP